MIKVNLQNTAVQNMLTGQNTLDSVFIDGNSILFIEKPEYLKQLYRDEIKARAIKVNLKVAREEIHKRTQDDRYNNLDDMETLRKFRAQTDELRETEKEYRRMLGECENVKMIPVYSGTKLDADRLERDCQWLQTKGCDINIMTTPGVPLAVEGGTLEEAIAALIEKKAA